jgi:hypothetical protein
MADFPSLNELFGEYQFLGLALVAAERDADANPSAYGIKISSQSVQQRFAQLREEVDQAFTLTLFASVEASVRTHYSVCLESGDPAWLAAPARALKERTDGKPRFEDILELWKMAPDTPQRTGDSVGKLKQLYHRRNWLAHGRYWSDRSGIPTADPDSVMDAVAEIRAVISDFPA